MSNQRTITITRSWDDHEPVILGKVARPAGLPDDEVPSNVQKLWTEFQDTGPDCDDEFIGFLCDNGYTEVEYDELEIIVGEGLCPLRK